MCRLFGFRSRIPSKAHRSLIEAENALAGQSTDHPDGWGIGYFVDEDAYVVKHAAAAHACDRFRRASLRLTSHTFVVHVRRPTVGRVDHLNAHPFRFGRWLFAHNGTIIDFEGIRDWVADGTDPELAALVLGDTDSEHLFAWLLTALMRAGIDKSGRAPSDADTVAAVVRSCLLELDAEIQARGGERPLLNVLLTDGRLFLAHRAGMPLWMSTQKAHCADALTCPAASKVCLLPRRPDGPVNHLLVASECIGGSENLWEPIPDGGTVVLDAEFRLHLHAPPQHWSAPVLPERFRIRSAAG